MSILSRVKGEPVREAPGGEEGRMEQAYVGRQPIYDRRYRVVGYELLFRAGEQTQTMSGDEMTSRVMVHASIDFGLTNIVGDKLAFVNMTRPFIVGDLPVPFPAGGTVLEVLADVAADDEVVAGLSAYKEAGYKIALDDYCFREECQPMLDIADLVKINITDREVDQLEDMAERGHDAGCKVVAERVETPEQLDLCVKAGFDLFQGYTLSRPEVVSYGRLDPSRAQCLALMSKLTQPDVTINDVDGLVRRDPGLVYRILRATNSASLALSRPVRSVREAVIMLGLRQLQSWVLLMLTGRVDGAHAEDLQDMLTRARMCELIAERLPRCSSDSAFTMGIVSSLDRVLGMPLEEVLLRLPMHRDITLAMVERVGTLGRVLDCAEAYERDALPTVVWPEMERLPLADLYLSALAWSYEVTKLDA